MYHLVQVAGEEVLSADDDFDARGGERRLLLLLLGFFLRGAGAEPARAQGPGPPLLFSSFLRASSGGFGV